MSRRATRLLFTSLRGGDGSWSRSSSCYVNRYYYDDTTQLDCWGGRYARAWYRFAMPSNAYNFDWAVSGDVGCCDGGRTPVPGSRRARGAPEWACE